VAKNQLKSTKPSKEPTRATAQVQPAPLARKPSPDEFEVITPHIAISKPGTASAPVEKAAAIEEKEVQYYDEGAGLVDMKPG